jgi:hypothetical protein
MDRTITTLHEYRLRYPESAAIPTLTQSGLLGLLLYRRDLKAASLARRSAMWRSVSAAPRKVCFGIWRALAIPKLRDSANRADVTTQRQA